MSSDYYCFECLMVPNLRSRVAFPQAQLHDLEPQHHVLFVLMISVQPGPWKQLQGTRLLGPKVCSRGTDSMHPEKVWLKCK